ncbi:MAG TPA: PIN domain-containing protein [Gaiellaceae bacterium]
MAVVVFDADVLIGFLARDDVHHREAVERLRSSLEAGTRRFLSAVNYAELLVGPLRAGGASMAEIVDAMLARFSVENVPVDRELARRAASVRAQTNLKLPDTFAVATAVDAQGRGYDDVRIESFDEDVLRAYEQAGLSAT